MKPTPMLLALALVALPLATAHAAPAELVPGAGVKGLVIGETTVDALLGSDARGLANELAIDAWEAGEPRRPIRFSADEHDFLFDSKDRLKRLTVQLDRLKGGLKTAGGLLPADASMAQVAKALGGCTVASLADGGRLACARGGLSLKTGPGGAVLLVFEGNAAAPACTKTLPTTRLTPPKRLPSVSGAVSLDAKTWTKHELAGMSFRAPQWFVAAPLGEGMRLFSEVMVDAPHGEPVEGEETRQWLRIDVRVHEGPLHEAACGLGRSVFPSFYPKAATRPGSEETTQTTVAGKTAWSVKGGMHGYDEQHVLVELGPRRSATLSFHTVGSYLWVALPERHKKVGEQQDAIVEAVLKSVHGG